MVKFKNIEWINFRNFKSASILGVLFIVLLNTSCSIQKKHYSRGYTLLWNKKTVLPHKNLTDKNINNYVNELRSDNDEVQINTVNENVEDIDYVASASILGYLGETDKYEKRKNENLINVAQNKIQKELQKKEKNSKSISGNAIIGLTLSVIGICTIPLHTIFIILFGVFGLTFSAIAIGQTKRGERKGKLLAILGVLLGIVDIIWFFALLI
jgi:hypothetical protein